MPLDRETALIQRRLIQEWDEFRATLQRIRGAVDVRPDDGWRIFTPRPGGTAEEFIEYNVNPVAFSVPERGDHTQNTMFVVVEGRIALRREAFVQAKRLQTHSFATHAGYFRKTTAGLSHVYGAHFDFSLAQSGHPLFHSQMKSFANLATHVQEHYDVEGPITDCVREVLRNVRVPTAQMDFFSFLLQVTADHLLRTHPTQEERDAFNSLVSSAFLQGAAFQVNRLATEAARSCYRARHWYAEVAS